MTAGSVLFVSRNASLVDWSKSVGNTFPRTMSVVEMPDSRKSSQHGDYWIEKFKLQRCPEGGYFTETYKCDESIDRLPARYGAGAKRPFSTHIYYLLKDDDVSVFHRLKTDELWHHYLGATLNIYVIDDVTKQIKLEQIGPEVGKFVALVEKDRWFAARNDSSSTAKFSLCGTTMAPGFEISDYEEGERKKLISEYPHLAKDITGLTRPTPDMKK